MFKRIVSSLIIFSLLWIDVVKAMDEEDDKTPPLIRQATPPSKRTSSEPSPKEFIDTTISHPLTEKSSLLVNGTGEGYQSTKLAIIPSSNGHSVNGHKNPKKHIRLESSSSDEEDRKSTDKVDSLGELEFKLKPKKSDCCWTCCWPPSWPSCCKKTHGEREDDVEASREHEHLFVVERGPFLIDLKKQLLLRLVVPSEDNHLMDVIHVEELEDREILAQKARFLFQQIQDTSLEDFGRWFQGHVLENRYTWKDWGGILLALIMAAGTGAAMSPIVEWSIYNKFLRQELKGGTALALFLARYINVSMAGVAFKDASSFMPEFTSPSKHTFTTPKSAREKRADRILIPLAAISGIYLLLLGFQIQQEHKKAMGTTGWWNEYDQYFYFSSLGFFPYLVAQSWKGMRMAVSQFFHPTVPEHVKEKVSALRQLEARLNHFSDDSIDDLYDLLKHPLLAQNSKFKSWTRYLCQGELADSSKVEGILSYLSLTNYAKSIMKEEVESEEGGHKTRIASRILASIGLPAGFGLVAISVFGMLNAFMDWKAALALSITAAALGFVPESFLQAHNVQETLDNIGAKESGPKRGWKETVKDPYAWGRGAAKVIGTVWAFLQNTLTNLAPIFVSLALLIPEQLGGSDTVQTAMTSVMITLAVPYLISELFSGTHDMWGHLVGLTYAVHDFVYEIYDRIVSCCKKEVTLSPRRQKREIRRILQKTIETTLRFTPEHVEDLDSFERKLEGKEVFN